MKHYFGRNANIFEASGDVLLDIQYTSFDRQFKFLIEFRIPKRQFSISAVLVGYPKHFVDKSIRHFSKRNFQRI